MANRTEQAIDAALHQPQQRSLTRQGEYVIKVTLRLKVGNMCPEFSLRHALS